MVGEATPAVVWEIFLPNSENVESVERASPDLLVRIENHGRTITVAQPGSEEMRYLDYMGAEANVGGPNMTHIIVRDNPGKAAVLEEFLHGTQFRLGLIDRLSPAGAEAHVKDFMIRHQSLLGLGVEDVNILNKLQERDQAALASGG